MRENRLIDLWPVAVPIALILGAIYGIVAEPPPIPGAAAAAAESWRTTMRLNGRVACLPQRGGWHDSTCYVITESLLYTLSCPSRAEDTPCQNGSVVPIVGAVEQ